MLPPVQTFLASVDSVALFTPGGFNVPLGASVSLTEVNAVESGVVEVVAAGEQFMDRRRAFTFTVVPVEELPNLFTALDPFLVRCVGGDTFIDVETPGVWSVVGNVWSTRFGGFSFEK